MVDKDYEYLTAFWLQRGSHSSPKAGLCAMEAVSWLEGLPHSDTPICTCPIIGQWVIDMNDHFADRTRQRLVPYLPRLVGTNQPEHVPARRSIIGRNLGLWERISSRNFPISKDGLADLRRVQKEVVTQAFVVLDQLLAVGSPGTFSGDPVARVADYKAMKAGETVTTTRTPTLAPSG